MARRRFTEREVLECLILQGARIKCFRCRLPFTREDTRAAEREHRHEVALGGPDTVENCVFSHGDCHKVETFGTGATTAGSSIGRIAKTKRILRTAKMAVSKPAIGEPRIRRTRAKPIPARVNPWPPKGARKMQNRGWRT